MNWESLYAFYSFFRRKTYPKNGLKDKSKHVDCGVTSEQKKEIKRYWGDIKVNSKWIGFYNNLKGGRFDPRYVPEDLYYRFADVYFSNGLCARYLDNKNYYDLLFQDVNQPRTIVRKTVAGYLDVSYNQISEEESVDLLYNRDAVIKPASASAGGRGISFVKKTDSKEKVIEVVGKYKDFIAQEVLAQHVEMSALHEGSINTLRILTLQRGGVKALSSIVRMGVGESKVDNATSGGIFVGVNEDGTLKNVAYNKHGVRFDKHPQGAVFADHFIPNYDECVELVKRLALRLATTNKLLSWDLAIAEDGHPILIEVNMSFGEIDFHQIANGPVFGDQGREIMNEVLSNKMNHILASFI